jgi:hypothetical protein
MVLKIWSPSPSLARVGRDPVTQGRRPPIFRHTNGLANGLAALCLSAAMVAAPGADACTRVLYETGTGTYIVGRSMDWNDLKMQTDFWVFPRGMARDGGVGEGSIP